MPSFPRVPAACLTAICAVLAAVPVAAARPMELVVHLPLDSDGLEDAFWAVATPGSPPFRKFLSAPELQARFGAHPDAVRDAKAWLASMGATTVSVDAVLASRVTGRWESANVTGVPKAPATLPAGTVIVRRDNVAGAADDTCTPTSSRRRRRLRTAASSYSVNNIKSGLQMPTTATVTNPKTEALVWGPGTYGYSTAQLEMFAEQEGIDINTSKVRFGTTCHGQPGGDNWGEATLDTDMLSAFALNTSLVVDNTNTSSSTEEGNGFGAAFLDFVLGLSSNATVPQVVSLSLGSLSAASCNLLCDEAVAAGAATQAQCNQYLQEQRQVCMYLSTAQTGHINDALKVLGLRGVTVFASSGDGGSHFSFGPFEGGSLASTLNDISCKYQMPVYPTGSPYVVSVGGTQWRGFPPSPSKPEAWSGSGGGFAREFAAPSFQKATVAKYLSTTQGLPPASSFNASNRAYPDLASVAIDGTSMSCPIVAGVMTVIVDMRLNAGLSPLGPLGPALWAVNEQHPGEAFEDITIGNTATDCNNGFPAVKGWDPVCGWGRPIWPGLVKHFATDSL